MHVGANDMQRGRQDRFRGLVAAPFTPFHADGAVHVEQIDRQAERLVADGVVGAFVCGTTGEGLSLTTRERMQVAARWADAARGRLALFVHVGHTSVADARALAAHAQEIGADAVACLAPFFFKPRSVTELAAFCKDVAAAAPALPFYYYHIPSLTGVALPMREFVPVAATTIPSFAGLKYTFEDVADFAACAAFDGGRLDMLFGRDELLSAGLAAGATGAVGSTYNYMAASYGPIITAWRRNDTAAALAAQEQANRIIDTMIRHGGMAAGKRMMAFAGIDCGPVRPPLCDLDVAAVQDLRRDLAALGFAGA